MHGWQAKGFWLLDPAPAQQKVRLAMAKRQELDRSQKKTRDGFFSLSTAIDLEKFKDRLPKNDPFSSAMRFLIDSWEERLLAEGSKSFNPSAYLAEDLSAAMLGMCPVVFMGTNSWATKPYLDRSVYAERLRVVCDRIRKVRDTFPEQRIACSLVPEKDYVLDRQFYRSNKFALIDEAVDQLQRTCSDSKIAFVYNQYLAPLSVHEQIEHFSYPDTHLPTVHYIQIFAKLLRGIDCDWREISSHFELEESETYGDLLTKFGATNVLPSLARFPLVPNAKLKLISGSETFAEPIGSTWQSIQNQNPIIRGKVLILGDSHSSILAQRRLTYLFAATFEECDFFWNPFGTRQEPTAVEADYVILEMSQRFLL